MKKASHARFGRVALAPRWSAWWRSRRSPRVSRPARPAARAGRRPRPSTSSCERADCRTSSAPNTIRDGDTLRIVNKTNAQAIGPHTFAMVARKDIPRTKPQRKKCFTPATHLHRDRHLARRQGANSPADEQPREGRDRRLEHRGHPEASKGDSWFTGVKPGTRRSSRWSTSTRARARRGSRSCAPSIPGCTTRSRCCP